MKLALSIGGNQIVPPAGIQHLQGGLSQSGGDILRLIFSFSILAAIVAATFYIAWSGLQMIFSTGEKQKVQQARERMSYIIIGLVIVLLAFAIIRLGEALFGINLLQFNIDPFK